MPTSPSQFPSADSQVELYRTGMDIRNTYSFDPGVCILPLAEDPPTDPTELANWSPVVVLRLHAPYRIRRERRDCLKDNNPPVMPSPVDAGVFVFVGGSIQVSNVLNQSFCNFDWAATSEYIYVENCVSRPEDGLVLGSPPFGWQTSVGNLFQFGIPSSIPIGAASEAGLSVAVGVQMSSNLDTSSNAWGYNEPSYYPGVFFNAELVNGGSST